MKRWQWYTVAVFAGVVALEALVYAAPAPNNCGLNMLCRVRTLIVSGDSTLANVTASTVKANVVDAGTIVSTGSLTVYGDATVTGTLTATLASVGTTGAWSVAVPSGVAADTNYGAFTPTSVGALKFRNVSCWSLTGDGLGTGTLAIQNVTDTTTLCSGSMACANLGAGLTVFDCNQAPTNAKRYAVRITSACNTQNPSDIFCNVEMAR